MRRRQTKRGAKTLTRAQANRTFAKRRSHRAVLLGGGCQGFMMCPQTCGEIVDGTGTLFQFPIITQSVMQSPFYQDAIRLSDLRVKLAFQPFLPSQEGCDLTAAYAASAHLWVRGMLVKQTWDKYEQPVAGPDLINPLSDQDWCEHNALHRWEHHQHPRTDYSQFTGTQDFGEETWEIDTDSAGSMETCCGNTSALLVEGTGNITTACVPCIGDVSFHTSGTMTKPQATGQTTSDCELRYTSATRPFEFNLHRRADIVLKEWDTLSIWIAYGGIGYDEPNCDPSEAGISALPIGLRCKPFVQGQLEF